MIELKFGVSQIPITAITRSIAGILLVLTIILFYDLIKYFTKTKSNQHEIPISKNEKLDNLNLLNSIFRAAPTGIGLTKNRKIVAVNQRICEMLGYQTDELVGKESFILYPTKEEYDFVGTEKYRQIQFQGVGIVETKWVKKNGEIIDVSLASTPLDFNDLSKGVTFTVLDITGQKRIREEMNHTREIAEESKKKYFSLFNQAVTGIALHELVFDKEGKAVDYITKDVNTAFETILSVKKEKVIDRKASEIISAEELKSWMEIFAPIALHGGQCKYQNYSISTGLHLEGNVFSVLPNQFAVMFNDITERKKAETELIKREAIIKTAEENLPIIFYMIDKDGIFTLSIGAGLKSLGLKTNEVVGASVFEVYKDYPEIIKSVNEALSNRISSFESHVNGAVHYNFLSPLKNFGLIGVALDITELKSTFKKLEQSRIDYIKLFEDHIAIKLLIDTCSGKIIDANNAAANYYGWTREQLQSMNISQINTLSDMEIENEMNKAIIHNTMYFEFKHRLASGQIRDVEVFTNKIIFNEKEVLHSIVHDVTDRKKAERELIFAKEKAEESDRFKTAFLQNMSHEIRTPMNAIMGFASLLDDNFDNKENLRNYTNIIRQRSNDLLDIINDILDLAKIESGQQTLSYQSFEIPELFSELKMFFKGQQVRLKKEDIELNYKIETDTALKPYSADTIKLKQIFTNLLNNAFKFTESGSVTFGCTLENDQIVFYVSDTGIGIPEKWKNKIFERFTQFSPVKNKVYGGTGLGLSIVKGLVDLMNGKIWLDSEPGKGTTFYFTIELKNFKNTDNEISIDNRFTFNSKKLLIVEDDFYNSLYLKEIMNKHDLKLLFAENGSMAVDISKEFKPDIILMDIQLPDMSGYEAMHKILEYNPKAKIIVQTAYAQLSDKEKAFEAGCVDYISKPIKSTALLSMIHNHLKN